MFLNVWAILSWCHFWCVKTWIISTLNLTSTSSLWKNLHIQKYYIVQFCTLNCVNLYVMSCRIIIRILLLICYFRKREKNISQMGTTREFRPFVLPFCTQIIHWILSSNLTGNNSILMKCYVNLKFVLFIVKFDKINQNQNLWQREYFNNYMLTTDTFPNIIFYLLDPIIQLFTFFLFVVSLLALPSNIRQGSRDLSGKTLKHIMNILKLQTQKTYNMGLGLYQFTFLK